MNKKFLMLTLCSSALGFTTIAVCDSLNIPETPIVTTDIEQIPEYSISISNLHDQQTLTSGTTTLEIAATITPELREKDTVAIEVDGQQVGDSIHATTFNIPHLSPGTHTLQAKVIQTDGKGAESSTITVFQQRISGILPPKHAPMAPMAPMAPKAPTAPGVPKRN